ncbi:type 1 glutamine amidotransferase domain-containing protein [Alteromonas stellipolaris]|uniref:type 1 glutamine amidotransferase domain-containing protein n=1 Tax=Alteromonas stellipolaris TaxID=233316 RepID=UPI0021184476|nr:type 1 glutamine amidotransferase domain-containing protein [Alteromonas stellipolaris]MCQ8847853.1 type 1 glutamine amidotransferase domain-containing protein [Alteromonas stellipolaris]
MKKILIPVTNHATLGTTDQANGTYSPEITHAIDVFNKHGVDYDIASINGGAIPIYGTDIEGDDVNAAVLNNEDFKQRTSNSMRASNVNIDEYDAVFYPGGFGLLSDLASNEDFAKLSAAHYENGGIIGAVCHGPAALLPIKLSNGEDLIASKAITGFTREEEVDYGTINDIPFLLEEALARKAAKFSKVQPWNVHVIEDERVITGQNPASAHAVAQAIVSHLNS